MSLLWLDIAFMIFDIVVETAICGSIRLAFMVSKGQLELDIINVTDLIRSHHITPPGTLSLSLSLSLSKVDNIVKVWL